MNANLDDANQAIDVAASTVTSESEIPPVAETGDKPDETATLEEFKISGDTLVTKVKELIHQGNVRRIIIKNREGHTLIEIPMTAGVIGGVVSAVFFPVIAAVGVIGAMVTHLTVVIERQASAPTSELDQD